ncbi:MAG: alpha-N-arabinofuranosidase [Bacteroidales bacterium]|nr:alpha-N-arabinofuranosidase [Bacteroidales bacterium]
MKYSRKTLILTIFAVLIFVNLSAQKPAIIKIDTNRKIGEIDRNIYGSFIEPLYTVVYPKLYDPESKLADENGFRKDLIELSKELKIPVVRWPGGNYVSGYNWEDGIGPKELRPIRMELAWNALDKNQMGTDEYSKFCELIGAKNFVCINAGTGTLDQARHWVEYCNVEKGTYYSDLRRKYGNEKPYDVKYWALGNEIDGYWQMGHKNVEDYCKFALEAAKLMEWTDKTIKLIACGAAEYKPDNGWIEWNRYILQHLAGHMDYLSVHRYVERPKDDFAGFMAMGCDLDRKIVINKCLIEETKYNIAYGPLTSMLQQLDQPGPKKPVYISFDEWSGAGYDLASALMVAQHLNAFVRNADVVKMANFTLLTELIGYSPEGDFKTAIYQPFYLFSNNCSGSSLDVFTDCENYSTNKFGNVPYLDVTAAYNQANDQLVINIVNRHEVKNMPTSILLQEGEFAGEAFVYEVNGKSINSVNTKDEQNVGIKTEKIKLKGNTLSYEFPCHSFTQIVLKLKSK